ncbi:MAG: hypothetical protein HYS89_00755 [Candidatus Colwellbacteria bacterium]|nr:hypothetical protein [Candidatus Colwellbacteria bacterium]
MRWSGNRDLSKWFIPFMALWGIFFGEFLPVCLENSFNCFPKTTPPGAKESMFSGLDMFIPTVVIYFILATVFWWLYRKLDWKIVFVIAIVVGQVLEFAFFRPQEGDGVNVVDNPLYSFLFFLIIWPILLVAPYGIFQKFFAKKKK